MKTLVLIFALFVLLMSCNDKKKRLEESKIVHETVKPNKKRDFASRKFEPNISFTNFKVNVENVKAKVDLNSNELGTKFKTAISRDYDNVESLFAGHYTLANWGCGSPCQMSVIIDRRNGKIYDSPAASLGYKFQKDSRMLIVNPPDSLGYYENCSYCKPEIYILNERTKKFAKK